MKMAGILIVLFFVVLLVSCCCLTSPKAKKLSLKYSGAVVTISKGETIEVALMGNPTTGFTWNIVEYDKNVLKSEGSDFVRESDLIGAGGTEVFKFSAIGKGKTNLVIQYNRVWEKDVKPLQVFNITVVSK